MAGAPNYRESTLQVMLVHGEAFLQRNKRAVCPVYDVDPRGTIDLLGTVILMKVGHMRFAISARHILDALNDRSVIGGAEGPVEIGRQQFAVTRGASGRTDRFDLTYAALTAKQVHGLGASRFLSPDEVDAMERPDYSRPMGSKYFILGYPHSVRVRMKDGEIVPPTPIVVPAVASTTGHYPKLGVSEQSHLLLDLDRRNVSDPEGPVTAPSFGGITGGAWSAPRSVDAALHRERLLGFFTEFQAGGLKTIVVTRIGAVLDGIKRSFPPLREVLDAT